MAKCMLIITVYTNKSASYRDYYKLISNCNSFLACLLSKLHEWIVTFDIIDTV